MMNWLFLIAIATVVVWAISAYNKLIALKGETVNAWKQIDVQLKRRHDLIPNLVEAVKGAMEFERERVLDIGCGAGRHSLYLQKKGLNVLAIDSSPLAIEVCKLRGLKKAKVMAIEDVKFKPNSFETIIMMGNNFGLFGSLKKAKRLLKKFYRMTSRNGLIIANTHDPYKTDNPDHREYHKLNKKKGRMGGQVKIRVRFRKYVSRWFDYLMVSKKEILKGTEWKVKKFIDSDNSQYVAVIEKV